MIEDIVTTGLAPFMNQVGWQGFAYGLLGLKAMRRMYRTVLKLREGGANGENQ